MRHKNVKQLSWSQCFAILDAYQPTTEKACEILGITRNQFNHAKNLSDAGIFRPDPLFDVTPYHSVFHGGVTSTMSTAPSATVATYRISKKRGRQGTNIIDAFARVPDAPMPVNDFIRVLGEKKVSVSVLRQGTRFDKTGLGGTVRVRRHNGVVSIWRDKNTK